MLGNNDPVTQWHILEDLYLRLSFCSALQTVTL